jgi:hypothetical protein
MRSRFLFLILVVLVAFIAVNESGLDEYVNAMVNEEDGWQEVKNGYERSMLIITDYVHGALLKDPKSNEINIYTGAIKKEALDRMTFIELVTVRCEREDGIDCEEVLIKKLKLEAKESGANVVAVQISGTTQEFRSESFGVGGWK